MTSLFRGVCSVACTKRRRFLWCAWWTGAPTREPFRPPDAWSGGARTTEEARACADRAAGMPLQPVDGHWAAGWVRVRAGLPAFPCAPRGAASMDAVLPDGPHAVLGVRPGAPLEEIKAAFRRKALAHHPDHGGDAAAFIRLTRAYERLLSRQRAR
jgi:hypothetical protein